MGAEPPDQRDEPARATGQLTCSSGSGDAGPAETETPGSRRPLRVFTEEALRRLGDYEEPPTAAEAELSGPWRVEPLGRGFGVFQCGDDEAGDPPLGRFAARHLALLAAAALPGLGRASAFRVHPEAGEFGYPVQREGVEVGAVRIFLADLAPGLDALETLLRSPAALALLLEAAGPTALERAGRVLGQRLAAGGEEEAR